MRVIVATTFTPFISGGGEKIAADLAHVLRDRGHEVESVSIPFLSNPPEMPEQMLALRLTDLTDAGDLLIALRTPSYLLRHPNKVLWFLHHHRGAYDLWDTPLGDIAASSDRDLLRKAFVAADDLAFSEARRIYAISRGVCARLGRYNRVAAETLYPPLLRPQDYYCAPAEDYLFFPSRIAGNKRQRLAIEAMAHVRSSARLIVAGGADTPEQLEDLRRLVTERGLGDRVEVIGRHISEAEKIALFSRCLATLYPPFEEDYGYVTVESFQASKPVITCHDSGGPTELVSDGVNGLIVAPTPHLIGAAVDRLMSDRDATAGMGRAGFTRAAELGISWDSVVAALVG